MAGNSERENKLFRGCMQDFARALTNCSSAFTNLSSGLSKLSECVSLYGDRVTDGAAPTSASRAPPFANIFPLAIPVGGSAQPNASTYHLPNPPDLPLRAPPAREPGTAPTKARASSRGRGRRTSKASARPAPPPAPPAEDNDTPMLKEPPVVLTPVAPPSRAAPTASEKKDERTTATDETEDTLPSADTPHDDDDFEVDITAPASKPPKAKSAAPRKPSVARKSPKVVAKQPTPPKAPVTPKATTTPKAVTTPKAATTPKSTSASKSASATKVAASPKSPPTTPKKAKASVAQKKTKSTASKSTASKAPARKTPAAKPTKTVEPSSPKEPARSPPNSKPNLVEFSFGEAAEEDEEMLDADVSEIESEADDESSDDSDDDDDDDEEEDDEEEDDDSPIVKLSNFSGRKRSREGSASAKTNKAKLQPVRKRRTIVDTDAVDKALTRIVYDNGTCSNSQLIKEAASTYSDMNVSENQWRIGIRRLQDHGVVKRAGRKGYVVVTNAVGVSPTQQMPDESPSGTPKKSSKQRSKISVRN